MRRSRLALSGLRKHGFRDRLESRKPTPRPRTSCDGFKFFQSLDVQLERVFASAGSRSGDGAAACTITASIVFGWSSW